MGETANLKLIHFEATTLIIASLKERVTSEDAESITIKKIPPAEKRARQENQERRLSGVCIQGELAPSHQLLDLANHIYESGAIIWVAPSKCTKRDDEVQLALKSRAPTVQIENSQLKVAMSQSEFAADSGSELKFQWCLQRRGMAYDQCYLLSWAVHEQLVATLLGCLSRTPPPGFQSVKLEQLVRADREIWTILARETKGSLKASAAGALPLDARVTALLSDPRITMMLLPLPSSHYSVLHNCTTLYYTVLLQYYSSTTLYYKVLLQYLYCKVLLQYYSVLQSTTPVLQCTTSTTPVLLCTTKQHS